MNNLIKLHPRRYFFLTSTVLLLIIFLSYTNSLHSPFHYDDEFVIKHDPSLRDINHYLQLKNIDSRYTLHLTFSLNYLLGELNPFGYHLVNISLHFFTSITIFFITLITIEKGVLWGRGAALKIAFITALFFSLNPVHTETVTYISGRGSGLASFFYFIALLLFILGSLKHKAARGPQSNRAAALENRQKNFLKKEVFTVKYYMRIKVPIQLIYLCSFIAAFISLTSKEISVTLPAAIILYDLCFMRTKYWIKFRTRLLYYYLPLPLLAGFAVTKYLSSLIYSANQFLSKIDILDTFIQFKIVNYAIKLYFLPINLTFDYHFPDIFRSKELSFLPVIVIFSLILLFVLKKIHKNFPALSFSVLWYLITISPTNSILPRAELFNERNLYLPSFGLSLFFAIIIHFLLKHHREHFARFLFGFGSLMLILSLNSALLIKRNNVYKTEASLWEDTLKKSPRKARVYNNLGRAYLSSGNYEKAWKPLKQLLLSNPSDYYAHLNLGKLYADIGDFEMAKNEFEEAIRLNPGLAEAYMNLGIYYASKGDFINARAQLLKGKTYYYSSNPDFYLNKATIEIALNSITDAKKTIEEFLKLFPDTPKAHFLMAQIYDRQGKKNQAVEEYEKSTEDNHFQAMAHNNIGLIYIKQEKFDAAIRELINAISINPALLQAHFNLGKLFMEVKKDPKIARFHFKKALELEPEHKKAEIIKKILFQLND